jgi:type I restriction enzyme R subunit
MRLAVRIGRPLRGSAGIEWTGTAANRLRVVRQVHYSMHHENSIDLVLLLNGIPVATAELKTDFTQSIDDAVDQYRFDRDPSPKGQNPEPLLSFPSGALVHFAISSSEVKMATKLAGSKTNFLPFNQGSNGPGKTGSAGNPVNLNGHKTAYLWEQVWQRDSWLDILGRYLIAERDDKKNLKAIIFPRFHQLDVTRELLSTVLEEGPGHKYLIQHSAGSGKTNSIAWTAHFLSDLHDAARKSCLSPDDNGSGVTMSEPLEYRPASCRRTCRTTSAGRSRFETC